MKDLLRDAIADAKAVRETAYANAKLAIEEAFTPHLQSIISAKLAEEVDGVEENVVEANEAVENADSQVSEVNSTVEEADVQTEAAYDSEEEDEKELDLESIIAELEEELASSEIGQGDNKEPSKTASSSTTEYPNEGDLYEASSEDKEDEEHEKMDEGSHMDAKEDEKEKDEMDETLDIQEIIRSLTEEDEEEKVHDDEDEKKKMEALQVELEAAYETIRSLQGTINEVNLLNAKLLYSNKLFKSYTLSESQKRKVIENFDRAKNIREVKLVFATLGEAFAANTSLKPIKESFASDPIPSTKPSKVITEGNDQATRFKQLAGIIK